ncbi:MAG TPA: hypothetical protein VFE91_06005 [Nitrososphaerales archaeon]|nr:hypothetical protein [Nitrososphaerales archaeon]
MGEIRLYVKGLLEYYEKRYDVYSQKVGALMRLYEKRERGKEFKRGRVSGWKQVGMLMVNSEDALLGTLEIMLDAMEEYKVKMLRTHEVMLGFDALNELSIPDGVPLTLFLRNGVPLRVLVDAEKEASKIEALAAPL